MQSQQPFWDRIMFSWPIFTSFSDLDSKWVPVCKYLLLPYKQLIMECSFFQWQPLALIIISLCAFVLYECWNLLAENSVFLRTSWRKRCYEVKPHKSQDLNSIWYWWCEKVNCSFEFGKPLNTPPLPNELLVVWNGLKVWQHWWKLIIIEQWWYHAGIWEILVQAFQRFIDFVLWTSLCHSFVIMYINTRCTCIITSTWCLYCYF